MWRVPRSSPPLPQQQTQFPARPIRRLSSPSCKGSIRHSYRIAILTKLKDMNSVSYALCSSLCHPIEATGSQTGSVRAGHCNTKHSIADTYKTASREGRAVRENCSGGQSHRRGWALRQAGIRSRGVIRRLPAPRGARRRSIHKCGIVCRRSSRARTNPPGIACCPGTSP